MKESIMDKVPLEITGYACTICHKWHRKGSMIFKTHWNTHFGKEGIYTAKESGVQK